MTNKSDVDSMGVCRCRNPVLNFRGYDYCMGCLVIEIRDANSRAEIVTTDPATHRRDQEYLADITAAMELALK